MRNLCVRVDEATYQQVSQKAVEMELSLSDFMRQALHAMCSNGECNPESESPQFKEMLAMMHSQLQAKDMQLERKETQLEQVQEDLSEQSKRHDTIVLQMTQQLDRTTLLLEDMRRRSWWKRLLRKDV
jgi:antitoxin component of RelBE/YafQ-DinJ toxin-antitoxin module